MRRFPSVRKLFLLNNSLPEVQVPISKSFASLFVFIFFPTSSWLAIKWLRSLPAMQKTQVQSVGQEDPLEKGMATHSSILAWEIPWTEELGGLQFMGLQRGRHDWATNIHISFWGDWLAFLEVWGLLPAFRCSVGVAPHADEFLIYLLARSWSPHLIPLLSWKSPLIHSFQIATTED